MRFISLAGLIGFLAVFGSCVDDQVAVSPPTGVRASVRIEPRTVCAGDGFTIEVQLVNFDNSAAFIPYCSDCDTLAYEVTILSGYRVTDWQPQGCVLCEREPGKPVPGYSLQPGARIVRTFSESTRFKKIAGRQYEVLPAGTYIIRGGDTYRSQPWDTAWLVVRD